MKVVGCRVRDPLLSRSLKATRLDADRAIRDLHVTFDPQESLLR